MRCDFKLSRVTRNGLTTKVLARIYVGDVTTEAEVEDHELKDVTRYRRSEKVRQYEFEVAGTLTKDAVRAMMRAKLAAEAPTIQTEKGYVALVAIDEQTKQPGDVAHKAATDAKNLLV